MSSEISISEAAVHCNVSEQTLKRFIQAGYIQALRTDGEVIYLDDQEVSKLLGVKPKNQVRPIQHVNHEIKQQIEPTEDILADSNNVNFKNNSDLASKIETIKVDSEEIADHINTEIQITHSKLERDFEERAIKEQESEDMIRLKHLCALQEQLLKKFDEDIADLKTQRQWLQSRVEKLEQKADRDQLMLLSHTQSIVKILDRKSKPSTLHKALSWIGIEINTPNQQTDDYETTKSTTVK